MPPAHRLIAIRSTHRNCCHPATQKAPRKDGRSSIAAAPTQRRPLLHRIRLGRHRQHITKRSPLRIRIQTNHNYMFVRAVNGCTHKRNQTAHEELRFIHYNSRRLGKFRQLQNTHQSVHGHGDRRHSRPIMVHNRPHTIGLIAIIYIRCQHQYGPSQAFIASNNALNFRGLSSKHGANNYA